MKKLIVLMICLVAALQMACDQPSGTRTPFAGSAATKILEIEGCEYIEYDSGIADQRVYSLTHKGNCKNPIHCYNKQQ